MFLYPALTIGFLFVAVPLLVHLINMLRHRKQAWAAMDFLLASYRKQKKWIRLRQLLLLLSRLAVAALLIAMLCGWTGGKGTFGVLGGTTTHHVVVLDDSYSMADSSIGSGTPLVSADNGASAYQRSLGALQDLTRRLASDDGVHQLTVIRASRAAMTTRGGRESADAAADLSVQTVTGDARLINRVMATEASPIRTDLVPALDQVTELINATPADAKYLYVASDFRQRDWGSAERLAQSMRKLDNDVSVRMIDCAAPPGPNLAITDVSPARDVWVAGVPVVIRVTVRNYSSAVAKNVTLSSRVIRYSQDVIAADPTRSFSGEVESLPTMVIEQLAAGEEATKSFQVFVTQTGTHAIEVSLPDDSLAIDNVRTCTLPLSDAEKVLVIDGDIDGRGAYHIASVLDPGSQVRIGAVPDVQPPSFLRSATAESLAAYRAIYLVDVPEIGENAADAISKYVRRGGGLAWFIGPQASSESYNRSLMAQDRHLLPAELMPAIPLPPPTDNQPDIGLGESASLLLAPLQSVGESAFSLVRLTQSWQLRKPALGEDPLPDQPRVRTVLTRRDGLPWVTQHDVGRGRVITVLSGLDGGWSNWPGDPTFVVFLLQSNALLWSGAAPPTQRMVDDPIDQIRSSRDYAAKATYLPASLSPPRIPIEIAATPDDESNQTDDGPDNAMALGDDPRLHFVIAPNEMVIEGQGEVDEVLRPGISEWVFNRTDGRGEVLPVASVIQVGEGDLDRADKADITQQLLPTEVTFVSSSAWSEQNRTAGSSTLMLLLLGLLALFLAAEQALAYWASYHAKPTTQSASHRHRPTPPSNQPSAAGGQA
ncbi:hypothetical protein K227x_20460 [Rubripirellula lacrimiformis]|uniref:Aerotolerance regulator N-terminal domain-containing protein n=1 Tax=Rubripirellula lacrimiformis TaxID=1930273 RepID=A0A517N959_9BACT|nr:BatA domain-containing protein [Rubripirellula lacrimiformis]QDT03662.1 hypothetical protein K227x_20460 [Rubripirellula lacrimiformis]